MYYEDCSYTPLKTEINNDKILQKYSPKLTFGRKNGKVSEIRQWINYPGGDRNFDRSTD